jgi:hypothetical protein
MITRLEATRYRCFASLGIDVGGFRVLVGANGSGKTTVLDLPCLLGDLLDAPTLRAMPRVLRESEQEYPAARWLHRLLATDAIFLDPNWATMRVASPAGLPRTIAADGRNIPWLALELKRQDAQEGAAPNYSSARYKDWGYARSDGLAPNRRNRCARMGGRPPRIFPCQLSWRLPGAFVGPVRRYIAHPRADLVAFVSYL